MKGTASFQEQSACLMGLNSLRAVLVTAWETPIAQRVGAMDLHTQTSPHSHSP